VLAVAFVFAAVLASSAVAAFPGQNGRIAYDITPPGAPPVIHTVLPSGHADKTLTSGLQPAWSPNGRRIAFTGGVNGQSEIYSMKADGTDRRRLTHTQGPEADPSYSPNGRRIVFESELGIETMRSDGSDRSVLVRGLGGKPTYSPDGRRIAYTVGSTAKQRPSIWVMDPNGTHKHRLLFLGSDGGWGPSYSPDGYTIAFSRCGVNCRYFFADSDGTHVRRQPCPGDYFRGVTAPSFSPDGRRLLGETPGANVVTLPLQSCSAKLVRNLSQDDAALPAWQPLP
jgi:dipeptidyl aminopeptidase/acylaminoacyl peptidase